MAKLLKVLHLAVVLVLILYLGKELARFAVKLTNPASYAVRFWQPGRELIFIGLGFAFLLGIASCSSPWLKRCPLLVAVGFHAGWLACLTWLGWFSIDAPFRLHELVGVDLADSAAIDRMKSERFAESLAVYVFIVLVTLIPLLQRLCSGARRRPDTGSAGPQGAALQHR